ncbi:TRAP transporter 4TM/12TM fusion protein [Paenibacillus sp. PvR098]|nr:TRAP transporter 4TM/12TM fusion protein [Paenibacillus sp. PvP091]MBP1172077.1 TRAP transporter 4TM/12TM fusion protein [Paenibacillus sp. PvR098]MBP2438458.1 TRAP transporter 4TM/12TM fusion protein [Paenibacillus sp. PvP052]
MTTRWPSVDPLSMWDITFGVMLVLLVLEATRRSLGPGLTSLVLLLIAYSLWGHYLPGEFYHQQITMTSFVEQMVLTYNGLFSSVTRIAATYVFMFILLGSFLEYSGITNFFNQFSLAIAGRATGGPAKIAVISSGLYGSISGSPSADVATTGSFTIPMMKKMGYQKKEAGAIEAVAGTGGSLLPPVMGSAAFIMSDMTGLAYSAIAVAALIPALLYYFGAYMQVHFLSASKGMSGVPSEDIPRLKDVLFKSGYYLIPIIILVYLLLDGYSLAYAAAIALLSTIVVSWFKKETRMGVKHILDAIAAGTLRIAALAAAVGAASLVVGGLTVTGLSNKFLSIILGISGDSIIIALLLVMLVCLLLGMGVPTPAAYMLTAAIGGPLLISLDIPLMAAHMFIMYYAVLSAITPPVAVAAYVAAPIAQENPMSIAWEACKIGVVSFIIPFMFIFNPPLLMEGAWYEIIIASCIAIIAITAFTSAVSGFLFHPVNALNRVLLLVTGVLLIFTHWLVIVLGLLMAFIVFGLNYKPRRPRASLESKIET